MKNQALFSSKDKSKKLKCCLLQFLFGALRVNNRVVSHHLFICQLFWTVTEAGYCVVQIFSESMVKADFLFLWLVSELSNHVVLNPVD